MHAALHVNMPNYASAIVTTDEIVGFISSAEIVSSTSEDEDIAAERFTFRRNAKMIRSHQPDEAVFRAVLPEDIDWKPFPAFPPTARLAVLVGHPSEPGPYVIRVKLPGGVKLMPHRHPEDRIYTVMSGVFYIGLGERFDGVKMTAYPPGSVVVLPGNTWHFHWAKSGEYVTQVTAIGPLGLEYLDSHDDPREQKHHSAGSGTVFDPVSHRTILPADRGIGH